MKLHVIVFDGNAQAPGFKFANQNHTIDITNTKICTAKALEIHNKSPVHAVITAGTDMSETVACIARALDLPGILPENAMAAKNKVLMRNRLKKFQIPQPNFRGLWKFPEVHKAMDELGLPLVLKPAENMGARGVIKIEKRKDIYNAYRHTKKYSKSGEMILEEYIEGDELSVDALIWKNKHGKKQIHMTGIADRIITGEPSFIELGHTMPSQKKTRILEQAQDVMRQSIMALGIDTGAAKGDLKITKDGQVVVGEIAARLSGGFMSSHTYPLSTGVNLLKSAIEIALNRKPENLKPTKQKIVIERCIIGSPGKITKFKGKKKMLSLKHIEHVFFMKKKGDILHDLNSNIGKAGHIIARASTLKKAEKSILKARKKLKLKVDDSFGLDWKEAENKARQKFNPDICTVCKICDGINCASGMPGMGGPGNMNSFKDNLISLAEYKIAPAYIHTQIKPDTNFSFLGKKLNSPIMTAPMTGVITNMGGVISEYEFARELLLACKQSNSIAWLGDGASPQKYKMILKAVYDTNGPAILICKPRADKEAIIKRFQHAADAGVLAVGMDIDAVSLKTMQLRQQGSLARNATELEIMRNKTNLPFIVKGILNPVDASACIELGADVIVVSNHGGRVLDEMPGTSRVLPAIHNAVGSRITVLADGGIRSGVDVFKMLALGAEGVLFGRMAAIAAIGAGPRGIRHLLRIYKEELSKTMTLCGLEKLNHINLEHIIKIEPAKSPSENV